MVLKSGQIFFLFLSQYTRVTDRRTEFSSLHRVCITCSESKKLCQSTFFHNFDKCWPIFKILSLLYSPQNLQQNLCHRAHHIKCVGFCCIFCGTVFWLTVYITSSEDTGSHSSGGIRWTVPVKSLPEPTALPSCRRPYVTGWSKVVGCRRRGQGCLVVELVGQLWRHVTEIEVMYWAGRGNYSREWLFCDAVCCWLHELMRRPVSETHRL